MTDAALPTYRLDDSIAVIAIDDGKANVLSTPAVATLESYLDRALADGARGLVIVGRPGKFSAGFDLAEMTASPESMRALVVAGGRWLLRLYGLGLPTVAACTGHALAGGALTLLACDVRVGADVPSKIGLNEVAIGMGLPRFAVELARDRIKKHSLAAATLEAQVYDAHGAAEVGYLDRVVPEDAVLTEALAEARRLATFRTGAYALTKTNLRGALIERESAQIQSDMDSVDIPKL